MTSGAERNRVGLLSQMFLGSLSRASQAISNQLKTPVQVITDAGGRMAVGMGLSMPPILINTMPKSGSIYIGNTIASSLSVDFSLTSLAHGVFPTYTMIPGALRRFRRGNVVRQEHIDASPVNLMILGRYVDRIVLHVRDPRQAMLSWAHHLNRTLKLFPDAGAQPVNPLPIDFIEWDFHDQIDWHIENHMASLVAWLRQWSDCTPPFKILWTKYEDLLNDERTMFECIRTFYGIPSHRFNLRTPSKTITYHYRSGNPDEWKSVLTEAQRKRCIAIIGHDVLDHFGWATL